MCSGGNRARHRLLGDGSEITHPQTDVLQNLDEVFQTDAGFDRIAVIQDVGDQRLLDVVQLKQRVVGDDELGPGMAGALGSDSSIRLKGIFDNLRDFGLILRLAEAVRLEF